MREYDRRQNLKPFRLETFDMVEFQDCGPNFSLEPKIDHKTAISMRA